MPFDINLNTAKSAKRSLNSLVDETQNGYAFSEKETLVSFISVLDTLSSAEVPTCEDQGRHTQLELILTHTATQSLDTFWNLASGLYQLVMVIMVYKEAQQSIRWKKE